MDINNQIEIRQQQSLAAGQIQSLTILAMTNQELDGFLSGEYLENPLLEHNEIRLEDAAGSGGSYGAAERGNRPDPPALPQYRLKAELLSQLDPHNHSRRQFAVMSYLIDCLDERGYFLWDLNELSQASNFRREELEEALKILEVLEPAGIFSRDLSQCLIRQLSPAQRADPVFMELLQSHLPDLLDGKTGRAAKALGIPPVQVKRYLQIIGTLNPRPLRGLSDARTAYVVPDVIVTRDGALWNVSLNDRWMGEYHCSGYYMRMMERCTDPELSAYFKQKLDRARFVLSCVEQRRTTLIRIVEAVLRRQAPYFENAGPLRPMTLEDIAGDLGLHSSTVSRAVREKYVQYKRTQPLRDLFTQPLPQNGAVSPERVKQRLRQLIEEEGQKPLSDQQLADLLTQEGLAVSRRAVTKYRILMDIPDSRLRRLLPSGS